MTRLAVWIWPLLWPLLAPGAVPQADETEDAFASQLEDVATHLRRRQWRDAERAILELLQAHAGASYVVPHLSGLDQDLRRAAFWKDVDEPDPKDLVSGELSSYSTRSGRIKIRYAPGSLDDFAPDGQALVHPMHFSGPWSVKIEGLPTEVAGCAWYVMLDRETGYIVRFGRNNGFLWSPHRVSRMEGRENRELFLDTPPECDSKAELEARIEVTRSKLRGTYDKKRAFELPRNEHEYGTLVLFPDTSPAGGPLNIGTFVIEGEIDRGWIEGLLDSAVAEQRAAFDAAWTKPSVLSAWDLADEPAVERTLPQLAEELQFDIRLTARQNEAVETLRKSLGHDRPTTELLLRELVKFENGRLPAQALAFLRFLAAMDLEHYGQALEHLETLPTLEVHALDKALLRGYLLQRAGDLGEARNALEALVREHPEAVLAHRLLAETLLLSEAADQAHAVILRGREVHPGSASLARLEERVVKAAKGPRWERVLEERGEHFCVYFEGQRKQAEAACRVLDEAWERCLALFGPLAEAPRTHSKAYFFRGEGSYLAYVRGLADASQENTLGIYSPLLKQVAVWNQPNANDLARTLRHECAHRYLDLAVGHRLPRWLNEGLAEVFANSWGNDGSFEPGHLDRSHLLCIARSGSITNAWTFVRFDDEAFLQNVEVSYALSWALVHFLYFQDELGRAVFDRLFDGLRQGEDPQLAIDRALDGVELEAMSRRFVSWLQTALEASGR